MSKYVCVVMSVSWASHHLQNLYLFPGLSLSKTFQTLHCSWPLWPDFKVTVALGTPESHLFLYLLLNVLIQSNPNCLSDHRAHHILCLSFWLAYNLLLGRRKKKSGCKLNTAWWCSFIVLVYNFYFRHKTKSVTNSLIV